MLDKTINPLTSTLDTINRIDDLYNLDFALPKNDRLTPSFFVYEKGEVKKITIENEQTIFNIGTSEENEVVITDPLSSSVQITVIRVGGQCYFMDCGTKDAVQFNGVQKRQEIIPAESRMVMQIGTTWIIYIGIDHHKYDETDSVLLKRSLLKCIPSKSSYGEVLLKLNNHEWYSSSAPILVGCHNSCDFRIDHPDAHPFHFLVYFSPSGLYVEDITFGRPGILINGKPSRRATMVNADSRITLNSLNIDLFLYGNIADQCKYLYADLNRQPGLCLSHLKRPGVCFALPTGNRKLTVGRSEHCDVVLEDNAASKIHAHFMVRDKLLLVQDNNSTNGTFLNRDQITKATVKPGDILELGDSCFLVHYQ